MSKIKDMLRSVIFNTPPLFQLFLSLKFGVEQALVRGQHHASSDHPSIIHFSLNKAATQFTKGLLKEAARANQITPVHINEYAFFTEFPYLTSLTAEEMVNYQHVFQPRGYLYSAFGGLVPGIPDLEKFKVVLMIRDPRDILVSWYFSIAFSHSIPPRSSNRHQEYIQHREAARKMSIDEHVISQSERVYTILDRYKTQLVDPYPHVYLTSYEEMSADFSRWLERLLAACELEISDRQFDRFVARNEAVQPQEEDKSRHIRKGKPGDYREKLQPETIAYLNEKFSPLLDAYEGVLNPGN